MNYTRSLVAVFMSSLILLTVSSCSKDKDTSPVKTTFTVSGNATGAQEVPAVSTTATGTITGTYDSTTNKLNYTITWANLSGAPNLMHFHGAALPGVAAGVQIGINGFQTSATGTVSGIADLNQTQEADLFAGKWYYNIHTAAHTGGEIRGQISLQ